MANPKPKRSPKEFKPGNQANLVHGGAGAVARLKDGTEFIGVAREAELAVYDELETEGRYALVRRNAARVQAACDLYWNAITQAAEAQDLKRLDHYVARFGWLAGVALRAWAQVKAEEKDASDAIILDAIAEVSGDD